MEKQNYKLSKHWKRKPKSSHNYTSSFAQLFLIFVFLIWFAFNGIPRLFESSKIKDWHPTAHQDESWFADLLFEDISPSERLEWHRCYQMFYCARLTVPMDYNRPLKASQSNPKVHIALVMKPGAKSGNNSFSQTPLLINPGGPGGSGTTFALGAAGALQLVIDPDQDIIGFDPRGIGATTPRADCFSYPWDGASPGIGYGDEDYITGNFHRLLWQLSGLGVGNVNSSDDAFRNLHARAETMAKLCQEKEYLHGNDSILRYVTSPNVAQDMISIIDAWDEWKGILDAESSGCEETTTDQVRGSIKAPILTTKSNLLYWGFSYGSLLGATFASMFPDRVGRVVLDGVVDADHYVAPIWQESIQDADAVYESFSRYCFEANEKCSFYRKTDENLTDIANRLDDLMMSIKAHPLSVVDSQTKTPYIVSYSIVRMLIFTILYFPNLGFPLAAMIFDLLDREEVGQLSQLFAAADMTSVCESRAPAYSLQNEAQIAIMCSDKRYPLNETVPELELLYEQMVNQSSFADVWLTVMLGCQGYSVRSMGPPMRWGDHPTHIQETIKTSHPILFLSNTYDPVTPLAAGLKMAGKFAGSGLIEQQSEGHCSLAATSVCTILALRAYFKEGKVPPPPTETEWMKCAADDWPWHPFGSAVTLSGGDVELQIALEAFGKAQLAFSSMTFITSMPMVLKGMRGMHIAI